MVGCMSRRQTFGGVCLAILFVPGLAGAADRVPPPNLSITVPRPPTGTRVKLPSVVPSQPGAAMTRPNVRVKTLPRRDEAPRRVERPSATSPPRKPPPNVEHPPIAFDPGATIGSPIDSGPSRAKTNTAVSGGGGLEGGAVTGGGGLGTIPAVGAAPRYSR